VGQFDSLAAVRNTPIRKVDRQPLTILSDVATVTDGLESEKNRVAINGQRGVVLRIFRRSGANAIEASNHIQARVQKINEIQSAKTQGFQLRMLRDGARPVREGIQDATAAILLGLVLTIGVVFFFLGNGRSTFITGLALPNSILGAFFLMWICGFSINITTLAALALAVGLLIDDAIVVRENIFRRMELGEKPLDAAVEGTREVTLAVTATTFTVLAVFGPVSFLPGLIGQFFKQFGLTICFAMLISLVDSLTIAPMLSAYFGYASKDSRDSFPRRLLAPFRLLENSLHRGYLQLLERVLRFPLRTLASTALICGISVVLLRFVPKAFVPSQEAGEFSVEMDLPAGATLDVTDQLLQRAADRIRQHSEVALTIATAGGEFGEHNRGQILVLLKPANERSASTTAVKESVRRDVQEIPNVTARVLDLLDVGGGAGHPYTVKISGKNMDDLQKTAAQLVHHLRQNPDLKDVSQSYQPGAQELRWTLDPESVGRSGISSGEVGYELRLLLAGARPAQFHQEGREYAIYVHHKTDASNPERAFSEMEVPNLNHQLVPLESVARKTQALSPATILREDRKPIIEVTAELNPSGKGLSMALSETARLFQSGEVTAPAGTDFEFAGQTKDFQDLLKSVILAGILSMAAMYLVLASLYESFFVPLAIMLVLPLAVCGAFYGLWLTHSTLDIYSMIGCILLMGVAAKNSILLVDNIQAAIRAGEDVTVAIRRASDLRFRPILMTSVALIAGMLPLALPLQEAGRGQAPMAIAVIGGVISSTLLTLVVVPTAYGFILKFESWTRRQLRL
jgi:HAE1 family hydrophobic/amphiphilic exporter-1